MPLVTLSERSYARDDSDLSATWWEPGEHLVGPGLARSWVAMGIAALAAEPTLDKSDEPEAAVKPAPKRRSRRTKVAT